MKLSAKAGMLRRGFIRCSQSVTYIFSDKPPCCPFSADYTTFILLEDDLALGWPALLSWASDTSVLQPRKFQRCFYRTEYREEDGAVVLLVRLSPHHVLMQRYADADVLRRRLTNPLPSLIAGPGGPAAPGQLAPQGEL